GGFVSSGAAIRCPLVAEQLAHRPRTSRHGQETTHFTAVRCGDRFGPHLLPRRPDRGTPATLRCHPTRTASPRSTRCTGPRNETTPGRTPASDLPSWAGRVAP